MLKEIAVLLEFSRLFGFKLNRVAEGTIGIEHKGIGVIIKISGCFWFFLERLEIEMDVSVDWFEFSNPISKSF